VTVEVRESMLEYVQLQGSGSGLTYYAVTCDWAKSEMRHSLAFGELRNGAKTKAGPLEAEQLSRLGNIATCQVTALHWRTLSSDTQTDMCNVILYAYMYAYKITRE
jgi:hypothetical protein